MERSAAILKLRLSTGMGQEIAISVTSRVLNGSDAIAFLSPLLPGDAIKERLIVAFLDGSGHILNWIEHPGDECGVDIPLRRIIAHALAHDAHGLLLAHNHPSGDPTPSAPDVEVTRQLAAAAHPLGLVVHDHLIRAADEWRSLTAMALI